MKYKQVYLVLRIDQVNEPELSIRTQFDGDKFNELCESIKSLGLIEPIVVKKKNKKFEIVAGHRRYLACKAIGEDSVNCVLVGTGDADVEAIKFAENVVREDVHPIDEATFLCGVMKVQKIKVEDLAKKINKSVAYIWERLQILEYPKELIVAFKENKIKYSVARELFKIKDINGLRLYLEHSIEGGATASIVKRWVQDYNSVSKQDSVEKVGDVVGNEIEYYEKISVVCDCCREKFSLDDTRVLRICKDCKGKLFS